MDDTRRPHYMFCSLDKTPQDSYLLKKNTEEWYRDARHQWPRFPYTDASQGTEGVVGAAIRESGIPLEHIFVTTKLPYVHPPQRSVSSELSRPHSLHHPGWAKESI